MERDRKRRVEIVKRRLLETSTPRIQVALILSLTGLAGFLTSFSLLQLGVPWMWLRYPIAILIAYCVFLLLLALWLWWQQSGRDAGFDSSVLEFIPSEPFNHGESLQSGGARDFGGGGAGGSWGASGSSSTTVATDSRSSSGIGFDLDLEEGWLVVIAIVALIGGLIASLYVIYIAPLLLAEILVDGALVAGLYKRVKHIESRHWLRAALRQTLLPAVLAAVFFTIAGYALQKAVPEAHSIGEVWNHMMDSER
jgi:hypothetical protein